MKDYAVTVRVEVREFDKAAWTDALVSRTAILGGADWSASAMLDQAWTDAHDLVSWTERDTYAAFIIKRDAGVPA